MDVALKVSAPVVTILLALAVFWWARKLARLTSELQVKVGRLSAELGYSIKQLERVITITREVHQVMYGEKQLRELEPREQSIINTDRIELVALASALDDKVLRDRVDDLFKLIDDAMTGKKSGDNTYEYWNKTQIPISGASQNVCQRAFELMKDRFEETM
jgi:hypothetical protein